MKKYFKNKPISDEDIEADIPVKETQYDWEEGKRGKMLVVVNGTGWMDITGWTKEDLVKTYEEGYLTGQAKKDAKYLKEKLKK